MLDTQDSECGPSSKLASRVIAPPRNFRLATHTRRSHGGTHAMSRKVVAGYTLSHRIGHGSFAVVFEGVHRSGHKAAIKAISRARLSARLAENLKSEIAILREATHPNIVQLFSIENSTRHIYVRTAALAAVRSPNAALTSPHCLPFERAAHNGVVQQRRLARLFAQAWAAGAAVADGADAYGAACQRP